MTNEPVSVVGAGMVSGVGLSGPTSLAAIRCGINNFQETRFMDSSGEWIVASEVPLEQPWRGPEKLGRMLARVIEESFAAEGVPSAEEVPVIVCFSERDRPGRPEDLNERVLEVAQTELGFELNAESITVSQGRVGGAVALREARKLLYRDKAPAVMLAATDSYLSAQTLNAFEGRRRLLTSENSDGFIPGEAACAVWLTRTRASEEPQLVLTGLGFGVEEATVESETPLRANGLVDAIRGSLKESGFEMGALDYRITDVSGEQYGFREASLAITRILRTLKDEFDLWHAADCIGEVGAVAGPAAINLAWHASENDYSKGDNILCHFGNDDGKRAAAVFTYQSVSARG